MRRALLMGLALASMPAEIGGATRYATRREMRRLSPAPPCPRGCGRYAMRERPDGRHRCRHCGAFNELHGPGY